VQMQLSLRQSPKPIRNINLRLQTGFRHLTSLLEDQPNRQRQHG